MVPMCNLVGKSDNYSKTSGSLWQNCGDEPDDKDITDSESFKF